MMSKRLFFSEEEFKLKLLEPRITETTDSEDGLVLWSSGLTVCLKLLTDLRSLVLLGKAGVALHVDDTYWSEVLQRRMISKNDGAEVPTLGHISIDLQKRNVFID